MLLNIEYQIQLILEVTELKNRVLQRFRGVLGIAAASFAIAWFMDLNTIRTVVAGILCYAFNISAQKLIELYPKHLIAIRMAFYLVIIESSYYVVMKEMNIGILALAPLFVFVDYMAAKFQNDTIA